MTPPTWEIVARLIISEGIPLAEALIAKWLSGNPPTVEDFEEFRTVATETARTRTEAKLLALGIPLDSDKAKEILALVG